MSSYDVSTGRQAQSIELTDSERSLMERLFANPSLWPDSAKVWIADYVSQNSLLPISQVQGFTQFVAQQNIVLTQETTTSTSYTDLATSGPTLTGISPGQYIIFYGARLWNNTAADVAFLNLAVNGAAPSSDDEIANMAPAGGAIPAIPLMRAVLKTFTSPNNSVQMKYKVDASTGNFSFRSLIALRVANP